MAEGKNAEIHSQTLCCQRESKCETSISKLSPSELGESKGRGGRKIIRDRVMEDTRKTRPSQSSKKVTHELTEAASTEPTWVYTRSSVYVL